MGKTTPFLTADEVAAIFRVHPRTVRNWAKAGKLHGIQVGRCWRFARSRLPARASTYAPGR